MFQCVIISICLFKCDLSPAKSLICELEENWKEKTHFAPDVPDSACDVLLRSNIVWLHLGAGYTILYCK